MIAIEDVRAAHAFLARRFGLEDPLDEAAMVAALGEAAELAGGRAEDEPAAVLVALTRRPRRLGDAWLRLPLVIAQNLARAHSCDE